MLETLKRLIKSAGIEYFGRYYGVYKAKVYSAQDPDNLGRLQLIIPSVYGEAPYKYWALPVGQYAGNGYGSYVMPEANNTVWVLFEGGNPRSPVWLHGWYGTDETPTEAKEGSYIFKSPKGSTIVIDDNANSIYVRRNDGTGVDIVESTVTIKGLEITLKNAQSIPGVSGALNCLPNCLYAGARHWTDNTITTGI